MTMYSSKVMYSRLRFDDGRVFAIESLGRLKERAVRLKVHQGGDWHEKEEHPSVVLLRHV